MNEIWPQLGATRIDLAEEQDFAVGEMHVSPASLTAEQDGERAELQPRVMQVLVALVRANSTVVSRDKLVDLCWDGRIVGDDALNRCILALRHLAQRFTPAPFVIETVPRVGHRLVECAGIVTAGESDSPGVNRRAVLAGGGVATAAVAGIAGWRVFNSGAGSPSGSIAVLPFANLTGDSSQGYFSDGIAEELRNALSRISGLKVVGRTSSEAVRENDAKIAARKLGVWNVLTGSVRQSSSTIRVSAQLVDGHDGVEKWSENYDRAPGDAIKIQTEIAESVANALRITLGVAGRAALAVGGTANPQAQELVFRSRNVANRGGAADLKAALVLVDQAIALDPHYAEAVVQKALLLNSYANSYSQGTEQLFALRAEALRWGNRAYVLAPDFAGAPHALAEINRNLLKLRTALAEYRRALRLAPGAAAIIRDYAEFLSCLGRAGESLRLADDAVALDRLSPRSHQARVNVLNAQRKFAETSEYTKGIRQRSPDLFTGPVGHAYALIFLNRATEALEVLSDLALPGNDPFSRSIGEALIYARGGKRAETEAKLALIKRDFGDAGSYQYGMVYSQLGDNDRAFAALDRAWEIRDSGLSLMKVDAFLDPIRADTRFDALVRRVDFPD